MPQEKLKIERESFTLISQDGTGLFGQSWLPKEVKALFCIYPDWGLHSGRINQLAVDLASQDIGVFSMDLRGHGNSHGKRGHGHFEAFLEDMESLQMKARQQFNETPMHLLGVGFSSWLVASFAIKRKSKELASIWGIQPYWKIKVEKEPSRFLYQLAKRFLAQGQLALKENEKSHFWNPIVPHPDPISYDPLVHSLISRRAYFSFMDWDRILLSDASSLKNPLNFLANFEADDHFKMLHSKNPKHFSWHRVTKDRNDPYQAYRPMLEALLSGS